MSKGKLVTLALGAGAVWYLFVRKDPPPADVKVQTLNSNPSGIVRGAA